jgi:outer membrane protein assembly factor BamA
MRATRALVPWAFAMASCGRASVEPTLPRATAVVEQACPAPPPSAKADPQALEKLAAKRIAKTCIYGVGSDDRVRVDGAFRSRAGQPLDLSQLHEDVRTLMASGRFEDIEVSAIPRGDEALLLFQFRERPPIAEVTFEGAAMLQRAGLEPRIAAETDKPITIANVYDAVTIIRDEYHHRGYRRVAIDVVTDRSNPSGMSLKIVVAEGPQFRFGWVNLNGASHAREADLRKATQLKQGTPFDDERVLNAVRSIEEYYLDHGFPNARVVPSIGESASDGTTPVGIHIIEGVLVRFGQVTIGSVEGTNLKAPAVKLSSKQGATYSRAAVDGDVQTLVAAFAGLGQKVVVVPRREFDPKKRTIDVVFQVLPHRFELPVPGTVREDLRDTEVEHLHH